MKNIVFVQHLSQLSKKVGRTLSEEINLSKVRMRGKATIKVTTTNRATAFDKTFIEAQGQGVVWCSVLTDKP